MDLMEVLDKPIAWFWHERSRLCAIQTGLERIYGRGLSKGQTVPEHPALIDTDNDSVEAKDWFYRIGISSPAVMVAYVPIGYIP